MVIMPMKEIKNTSKTERICLSLEAPVAATKNGYAEMILLSSSLFDEMVSDLNAYYASQGIMEGLLDYIEGRVTPIEDVFREIDQKYGSKD